MAAERRRQRSYDEKARLVEETFRLKSDGERPGDLLNVYDRAPWLDRAETSAPQSSAARAQATVNLAGELKQQVYTLPDQPDLIQWTL